jgi:hypothetical protein
MRQFVNCNEWDIMSMLASDVELWLESRGHGLRSCGILQIILAVGLLVYLDLSVRWDWAGV